MHLVRFSVLALCFSSAWALAQRVDVVKQAQAAAQETEGGSSIDRRTVIWGGGALGVVLIALSSYGIFRFIKPTGPDGTISQADLKRWHRRAPRRVRVWMQDILAWRLAEEMDEPYEVGRCLAVSLALL